MLVEQALHAKDIWTGETHDKSVTESMIKEIRKLTCNIVLCGMPSAGKSSVGEEVAKKLGIDFFDSDLEIYKKHGKTPSDIIKEKGETAFRDIEGEVVKELSIKSGAVIALGGGAVLREENIKNLKRNGVIVYIKRELNLLTDTDRPISQKEGINTLYEKRKGIYESVSDITVENNKLIEDCVRSVLEKYENTCN